MKKSFLKKIFSTNPMAENKEGEKTDMAFIVFKWIRIELGKRQLQRRTSPLWSWICIFKHLRFNEIGFKMFRKQLIEGTALKGCTKNQKTRLHKYLGSIVLRAETRNGRYTLTQLVSPWRLIRIKASNSAMRGHSHQLPATANKTSSRIHGIHFHLSLTPTEIANQARRNIV